MTPNVSYFVAFGGGLASFLSPCVLPVVPIYLSVLSGSEIAQELESGRRRVARTVGESLLFIAGFGVVFILIGVGASLGGGAIIRNRADLTRISGWIVIAFSTLLIAMSFVRVPMFAREFRFHPRPSVLGPFVAPVTGAAFGLGWTPCLGPVLASISVIAATQGDAAQAAALLAFYTVGLGLPLLVLGVAFSRLTRLVRWLQKHSTTIVVASACMLAAFGVLLVLNRVSLVTSELESVLRAIGLGRLITLG